MCQKKGSVFLLQVSHALEEIVRQSKAQSLTDRGPSLRWAGRPCLLVF